MKKSLIFIFLLVSLSSFADAGNAYRFNLTLVSNSGDTINGYIYHYTYKKFEQTNLKDKRFKEFIDKDTVTLYSSISKVTIGELSLDFTKNEFKKTINLINYSQIGINDFLDFGVRDRLFELSDTEYDLIKINQPKSVAIYNEKYAENCSIILLTWNNNIKLSAHKTEISEKIESFSDNLGKHNDELNNYYIQKRNHYSIKIFY